MINTADLTTVDLEGDGVLDVIMQTAALHLGREFKENRIRGNDYADVYTKLMQGAMTASIGYAMQKPLTEAQTLQVEAETINVQAALPNIQLQDDLTAAQISKTLAETDNVEAVLDNANLQSDLTTAQINGTIAETANTVAQLPAINLADEKVQAEIDFLNAQRDNEVKECEQTEAETALIIQKTVTELAQTDDSPIILGSMLDAQRNLVYAQTNKSESEKDLLDQKKRTEEAQTVDLGIENSGSVIGRQLRLYNEQARGYIADRNVKAAKLYTDVLSVQLNINEGVDTSGTGLTNPSIGSMMARVQNSL